MFSTLNRTLLPLLALALLLGLAAPSQAAEDYARFLPNNGNDVYEAKGLLRSWPAAGPKELWRIQLGVGKSAVVESGGRAFTCTQIDMKQYAVCLDPKTGDVLWKTMISPKDNHHQVKGPVATPLVDGDRVYCIPYENNNGDIYDLRCPVYCLKVDSGEVIWRESDAWVSTEGSTPLIVGDTLYVGSNGRASALVAVDKMTGKLKWKTPEPNDTGHASIYGAGSSLTYQVVQGIPQIIVSVYRNDNMGVDARTGAILWHWRFPTPFSSGLVSTPVAIGDKLFMSGFQGPSAWGVRFDMKVVDGKTSPTTAWISNKQQCNAYNTVSIVDGAIYGFGRGENDDALQCTDFETGKLLWQQEGPEWSRQCNMTVADGLIFTWNKSGELILAEANKVAYKELARFNPQVKQKIQQQPTIYNGRMYLRGDDTIACYKID